MITKMKLKSAKKSDIKGVVRLFETMDQKVDYKKILNQIKKKKIYVLKDKKRIKAIFSHTIIGILGFFAIMWVSKIIVAPEFQNQGIGTFLLSRIRKFGVKAGVFALLLYSRESAIRFYEKNNFKNIWKFFWWRGKVN